MKGTKLSRSAGLRRNADIAALREEIAALERRRDQLRDEHDKYLDLYDKAPDMCASLDAKDGTVLRCNAEMLRALGYTREETIGASIFTFVHPDDRALIVETMARLDDEPDLRDLELRVLRRDESSFPISLNVTVKRDADGHAIYSRGVARDVTVQRQTEHALAMSESRMRRVTETHDMVPWQLEKLVEENPAGRGLDIFRPVYVGEQLETLFGYPVSRWDEPGFLLSMLHPEDRPIALERAVERWNLTDADRQEYRVIAADGREVPVLMLMSAVRRPGNRHILSGVVVDLTEIKAAEAAQQNFVRELDHRVKNTFAIVQSVIDQTLAATDERSTFLDTFRGRIAALAAVHSAIARSDWASLDLVELVRASLKPFGEPPRVCTRGEPVSVGIDIARSLGMVLHELATNAAKYGSLSSVQGVVSVSWRRRGVGDNDAVVLDWVESGGPTVAQASHRGYGLRLIEELVPFETGGKANVQFAETGFQCEIEIPLGGSEVDPHPDPAVA